MEIIYANLPTCSGCFRVPDYTCKLTVSDEWPRHRLLFEQDPLPDTLLPIGVHQLVIRVTDPNGNVSTCETQIMVQCAPTFLNTAQTAECPAGQTGDSVTIAAGQYSGTTQEEADAAALAAAEAQLQCCPCGDPDCSDIEILTTELDDAEQAVEYSFTLEGDPGNWYVTGLPDGLSLDINIISGTPTEYGDFPIAVLLTDTINCHRCLKAFTLTVAQFHLAHFAAAFWPFDLPDQLADVTGTGNDLTGVGEASVAGVIAEAASLGGGTLLSVESSSISFPIADGFTVAGFFKRDSSGVLNGNILLNLTQGGSAFVFVNNQENPFNPEPESFRFFQSAGTGFTTPPNESHFITPSHGVFIFFAAWLDPSGNKLKFRLNDTVFTTSGVATPESAATASIVIQSSQTFILDEMGFWPRMLSTADVTNLKALLLSGHSWPFV